MKQFFRSVGILAVTLGCMHLAYAAKKKPIKQSCSSEKKFKDNVYIGCKTIVNGHESFSDPKDLTELGCDTFCTALKGQKREVQYEMENMLPFQRTYEASIGSSSERDKKYKPVSPDVILSLLPHDGKVGECTLSVSAIYSNDAKTIVGGLNFELKSGSGEVLDAYSVMRDSVVSTSASSFYGSDMTKELDPPRYAKFMMSSPEVATEDSPQDIKDHYRWVDIFTDKGKIPAQIIGINLKRYGKQVTCGVVDEAGRIAYEKSQLGKSRHKKTRVGESTKLGN